MVSDLEITTYDSNLEGGGTDLALERSQILLEEDLACKSGGNSFTLPAGTMGYIQDERKTSYTIFFYDYGFILPVNKDKVIRGVA